MVALSAAATALEVASTEVVTTSVVWASVWTRDKCMDSVDSCCETLVDLVDSRMASAETLADLAVSAAFSEKITFEASAAVSDVYLATFVADSANWDSATPRLAASLIWVYSCSFLIACCLTCSSSVIALRRYSSSTAS